MLRYADLELDRQRRRVTRHGRVLTLTAREFSLLDFLMSRAPDAVSRSEIIEHVWDMHFDPQTNLVEVYINRLRQKMSTAAADPKIIQTVPGSGYCLRLGE